MNITISKDVLSAAALVAATKDIRYYLNGVYVFQCNSIVYVAATDGSSLFIDLLPDAEPAEQDFEVIIPIDTVKRVLKAKIKDFQLAEKSQDGMWTIGPEAFKPIDERIPDVLGVIPSTNSNEHADFDFERLAIAQKALRLATGMKHEFFRLSHNGPEAGAIMRGNSEFPLMLVMSLHPTAANRFSQS